MIKRIEESIEKLKDRLRVRVSMDETTSTTGTGTGTSKETQPQFRREGWKSDLQDLLAELVYKQLGVRVNPRDITNTRVSRSFPYTFTSEDPSHPGVSISALNEETFRHMVVLIKNDKITVGHKESQQVVHNQSPARQSPTHMSERPLSGKTSDVFSKSITPDPNLPPRALTRELTLEDYLSHGSASERKIPPQAMVIDVDELTEHSNPYGDTYEIRINGLATKFLKDLESTFEERFERKRALDLERNIENLQRRNEEIEGQKKNLKERNRILEEKCAKLEEHVKDLQDLGNTIGSLTNLKKRKAT